MKKDSYKYHEIMPIISWKERPEGVKLKMLK